MNRLYGGVVLAGGKGKRLMPLTAKSPKPLLPLGNKTPLSMALNALNEANIQNIAVTTGYLADDIENFPFDTNCKTTFFRETFPMGTSGMILKILHLLENNFFVVSADCVFDFKLSEMMIFHKERNADVTIATINAENPTEYGTIVSENGRIVSFREKPSWKQTISTKVNAGIYIIKKVVLESLEKSHMDFASDIFPCLLKQGKHLAAFDIKGFWCDMGTPKSYYKCNMHFSKRENVMGDYISISSQSAISESIIMNGARVGEGTKISNSVIGEGVSIGKNCIIEGAIVGPDSLICDNVTIKKESIIPENSILSKGKIINRSFLQPPLFCDSGKVSLTLENAEIFGKALSQLPHNSDIYIFYERNCSDIGDIIFNGCKKSGRCVSRPLLSTYYLSSFVAAEKNAYCVFIEYVTPHMFNAFVFDTFGLLISREEQLKIEKYIDFQGNDNPEPVNRSGNTDPTPLYIQRKVSLFNNIQGEKVNLISNNLSSSICEEILKSLGAQVIKQNFHSPQDIQTGFRISHNGIDAEYVTEKGEIIDKYRLFAIASTYYPQENIPLPDFVPEAIKTIISRKGSYSLYGDSINGRKKDLCLYSFFDGISIVLSVVSSQKKANVTVEELNNSIPPFAFLEKDIVFEGNKGDTINALFSASNETSPSGIAFNENNNHILVFPNYGKSFKIFAESFTVEAANEMIIKTENRIRSLNKEK